MNALRQSPLFAGLRDDQMAEIIALGEPRKFLAGEQILTLNDTNADFFMILQGRAHAVTQDADQLMELGPGSAAGLLSFLDGRPQPMHVVAAALVETVRFPARELRSLMNRDRDLGFVLLGTISRVVSHRYRLAIQKLDELMDEAGDVWENSL